MECGFFFLSGEEELTEYILFLGAAGREDAGLPNSSLWWKRLKADTHFPNGFRGLPKHRKPSSAGKTFKK